MKKGMKEIKAQVSVFIIVSIFILGVLAFIIFFNSTGKKLDFFSAGFSQQSKLAQADLSECFNNIYQDSLDFVGIQGGYYREPFSEYINVGSYNIPFYYFENINFIPPKEIMEVELRELVDLRVQSCFNIISAYNLDYDMNYKPTEVSIKDDEVVFTNNLKLKLIKDEQTADFDFKKTPFKIKSKLLKMNEIGSYMAYSYKTENGSLCMSCFEEIAEGNNLFIEINDELKDALFVSIFDNRTEYYPASYNFLMKSFSSSKSDLLVPSLSLTKQIEEEISEAELNKVAPKV